MIFCFYLAHFQARDTMRNGSATFQYDDVSNLTTFRSIIIITLFLSNSSYRLLWEFEVTTIIVAYTRVVLLLEPVVRYYF